jgi:hypothetical protein
MGLFNGRVGMGLSGFGGVLIALCATGCGGGDDKPSGSSADFSALQKQYTSPSGTLHATDKAAIIAGLDNANASESSGVGILSARMGGTTAPPGSHVLAGEPISCPTTGNSSNINCTCAGGGSVGVSASASQGSSNVSATESYNSCKITEGTTTAEIDGTVKFAIITDPPPMMEIFSGKLTETVTPPGETVTIDMEYALVNGVASYNVQVGDGNVLIQATGTWDSTTDSGSFTVVTKDGTTTCTLTNGAGSCTGAGGSVTFS